MTLIISQEICDVTNRILKKKKYKRFNIITGHNRSLLFKNYRELKKDLSKYFKTLKSVELQNFLTIENTMFLLLYVINKKNP